MLPFPNQHREITQQLLNGKFILQNDGLYNPIYQDRDMYSEFFSKTYDYELVVNSEFIYLKSTNEKDKNSRDFLIFLALLCRELDKDGKDFKQEIESESFLVEDITTFLSESSKKKEIIENTSIVNSKGEIDLVTFLNEWQRRNVIQYVGNSKTKFRFTKAVGLFFDFATTLANEKLKQESNEAV
jgi:chromosome condensin MukBEF MukE localization factor